MLYGRELWQVLVPRAPHSDPLELRVATLGPSLTKSEPASKRKSVRSKQHSTGADTRTGYLSCTQDRRCDDRSKLAPADVSQHTCEISRGLGGTLPLL